MKIYSDGGCRGNPGPGIACIKADCYYYKFIGDTTNNIAEYTAFIMALEYAMKLEEESYEFLLDSNLVVNQVNGKWKVNKNARLVEIAKSKLSQLRKKATATVSYIPREKNKAGEYLEKELQAFY